MSAEETLRGGVPLHATRAEEWRSGEPGRTR